MWWKEHELWSFKSQIYYSLDLLPESTLKALCDSVFLFCKVDIIRGPLWLSEDSISILFSHYLTTQENQIYSSIYTCMWGFFLFHCLCSFFLECLFSSFLCVWLLPVIASPSLNILSKMKLSAIPTNRSNFSLLCVPATLGGARWH